MEKKLRLSPKGVLRFAILLAAALYLWNFFRGYLLFLALVILVCALLLSGFCLWSARNGLQAQVLLPENRVGRNTEFPFSFKVANPRKLMAFTAEVTYSWSNLFTGYKERKKERLWVAPAVGGERKQRLNSRYAGRVEVRIEAFKVFDLFHIFCLENSGSIGASTLVWPGFSPAREEEPADCVEGFPKENEARKRGVDYNPDYEIREYVPGDELKNIHWKLSARQQKLMTRERRASGHEMINLLLPLGEDREENDSLVDAAYALCRLLLHKEYPLQLYWAGRGNTLRSRFMAEQGELEQALSEILSDSGIRSSKEAKARMAVEHPTESYILIQTGAYKGAYIQ